MINRIPLLFGFFLSVALMSCEDKYAIVENTPDEFVSLSKEEVWMDSLCSKPFAGRKAGTDGNYLAYEYLISEVKALGFSPKTMAWTHKSGIELRNIIVPIEGVIKDSIFIIGAHFDGQFEGNDYQAANDNGSGVVTALSILDSLSRVGDRPRYSTYVCFWDGEEACVSPAFKGSSYFVDKFERINSVVLYVNIDAMGHNHDNAMILGWYNGFYHSRVTRLIERLAEDHCFDYSLKKRGKGEGSSDYVSFSRVGIPYISYTDIKLSCDFPTHSTKDTKDAIDFDRLRTTRDITIKVLMYYL